MTALATGGARLVCSRIMDGVIEAGRETVVVDSLRTGRSEHVRSKAEFDESRHPPARSSDTRRLRPR